MTEDQKKRVASEALDAFERARHADTWESMSAHAHVSAAASLLLLANPNLDESDIGPENNAEKIPPLSIAREMEALERIEEIVRDRIGRLQSMWRDMR